MAVEFIYDHKSGMFSVPGPDLIRDRLIPLNVEGATLLGSKLGVIPVRASLSRWRVDGYPVDRSGPRVLLPCITRLKKVHTSPGALIRWLRLLQALGDSVREAGGVRKWEDNGGAEEWVRQNKSGEQPSTSGSTGSKRT